ncbi:MAG: hypothetical protein MPJ53_01405 [Alphaproteobacteria bacterium]|nr:hypothetical protein [Alphaproteobacteria bacterium]
MKAGSGERGDQSVPTSRSDREWYSVPYIFEMKWVGINCGAAIITLAALLSLSGESLPPVEDGGTSTFLHTNIEILVATFAVTLGVTLLGLQFMAQSYSMQALMRYIKNGAVYSLVLIFIALISVNMTLVYIIDTAPGLKPDHEKFILPMMMGLTACSLYYLAGYVFFMVGRTQLRYMLKNIEKDMKNTEAGSIAKHKLDDPAEQARAKKNRDSAFVPFQIWEQVAFKAVADGNMYVFRESIRLMIEAREKFRSKEDWKELSKHTLVFLKPVMLQCARTDRVEMVEHFLNRTRDHMEPIFDKNAKLDETSAEIVAVWTSMMRESIIYNNVDVLDVCVNAMVKYVETSENKWKVGDQRMDKITDFVHAKFSSLVGIAVSDDHHAFMRRYIDFVFGAFEHITRQERLYRYAMSSWEAIMSHAIDAGNYKVFEIGITRMFYYIDRIRDVKNHSALNTEYTGEQDIDRGMVQKEFNVALLRLCERMCAKWDRRYVEALFRKYPSWRRDKAGRPDQVWMLIMLESIRRGDVATFDAGLDDSVDNSGLGHDAGAVSSAARWQCLLAFWMMVINLFGAGIWMPTASPVVPPRRAASGRPGRSVPKTRIVDSTMPGSVGITDSRQGRPPPSPR